MVVQGGKTGEHAVLAAPNAPAVRTPNACGGRRSDGLQAAAATSAASSSPAVPRTIPTPPASRSISVPASGTPGSGGNKARVARWSQSTAGSGSGSESAAGGSAAAAAAATAAASGSGWAGGSYGSSPSGARSLYGSSPGSSAGGLYGSSPAGSGRRARRNAKRAAQDYVAEGYAY